MAGKHDVYVFQDSDGTFKVRPPVAFTTAAAKFSFRNLTPNVVDLAFPKGLIKDGVMSGQIPANPPNPPNKPNHANDTSVTFDIDTTASGFFAYQVHVEIGSKKRKKLYGESDPGMIVDP